MLCSRHSRQRLFDKQGGLCFYCGRKMVMGGKRISKDDLPFLFTKDHIVPRSKGGRSEEENFVGACYQCNQAKGDKDAAIFTLTLGMSVVSRQVE